MIGVAGVIHSATVMLESVADHQPVNMKTHVVSAYLVEDLLSEWDMGSFVFQNHQWLSLLAVDDGITSLACIAQGNGHLVGHQACRISFVGNKEMCEMLPHPLLGSKSNILLPERVEDHHPSVGLLNP